MMTPHPFRFSLLLLLCMFLLFPLSASAGKGEKVLPEGSGYAGLEDLCSRIDRLGVPETVDLEGVPLPVEDRKALLSRYPGVRFLWTMEL